MKKQRKPKKIQAFSAALSFPASRGGKGFSEHDWPAHAG
jgi:hypothetical protein